MITANLKLKCFIQCKDSKIFIADKLTLYVNHFLSLDASDILKGCVFVLADYMERLPEETYKIWLDVSGISCLRFSNELNRKRAGFKFSKSCVSVESTFFFSIYMSAQLCMSTWCCGGGGGGWGVENATRKGTSRFSSECYGSGSLESLSQHAPQCSSQLLDSNLILFKVDKSA